MQKFPYIINVRDGVPVSLSTIINSRPYTLSAGHMNFHIVVDELKKKSPNPKRIVRLMQQTEALKQFSENKVTRNGDKFYYKGNELNNSIVQNIRSFMRQDLPWKPMFRFLENLMQNPSEDSRNSLYDFLQNENLPITPDGCFLGYKGAQANFWSIMTGHHTMISGQQDAGGHLFYGSGEKLRIPWEEVCADRSQHCARGLHVGAFGYASSFAGEQGALVLVKVHPKDVVSVPYDNKEVMRACAFEVVKSLPVRVALHQAFEPQFIEKGDEDEKDYYNVRDSHGRFVRKTFKKAMRKVKGLVSKKRR